jgi:tRNA (guanine37-N1)-methyltransferase
MSLKVPKDQGEKTITLANKLGLVDKTLEIQRDGISIYIPLSRQPSKTVLKTLKQQISNIEVLAYAFSERLRKPKTLLEILEGQLAPHLLAVLPRSADIVGDIAIIEIPPELEEYRTVVGEAVLKVYKNVRTVLAKAGAIGGTYRLRGFSVVAGEPRVATLHKEHGCQFYVDVTKTYFSPRLSSEHHRVANLVQEGETIVDLFAGIGPFALPIAKIHENVKVYAVDINPAAIELLERNVRLNRVENKVYPFLGDARQVVKERLSGIADRVIMNLPEKAMEFVDVACMALKPTGGIVHFYGFVSSSEPIEKMLQRFTESVTTTGRRAERVLTTKLVRATAPYEWQAVLDVKIR